MCENCAIILNSLVNFKKMKTTHCDEFTAPFIYYDLVREAILKFKFENRLDNSYSFAFFMKNCDFEVPDLVIGVPVFKNKTKLKLCKNLVENFCNQAKLRCVFNVVEKNKLTKKQHECGLQQRLHNLNNVFSVVKKHMVLNKRILICDDIITSGATIEELSKELKKSGAKWVGALAIAVSKVVLRNGYAQVVVKQKLN